jgi:glucose-6-phosphate 1-dehydrogenase
LDACRDLVSSELDLHAAELPTDARRWLAQRISYIQIDVHDTDSLRSVSAAEPMLIYVATPPTVVPATLRAVERAELLPSSRVVLDKPFGLSRGSAEALNTQIESLAGEDRVYRVDHFLYHHTVQELIRWRVRADPLSLAELLPIAGVEIVWDETRPAQTGSFPCGVVCDMVQSHLLQLAAVITMEPPDSLTQADLAQRRLAALRDISIVIEPAGAALRGSHLGEGNPSARGGEPETFVALELRSQMPRWRGVRFHLRAAKGIDHSRRHIEFRLASRLGRGSPHYARLEVLPGKVAFGAAEAESALEIEVSPDPESASTRLLRAALAGDDTFSLHPQEPVEGWRIVEPVLDAWERDDAPILAYPLGASAASVAQGHSGAAGA